jgi:membrane protease YdiL (CAAX protease family)
MKRIILYAVTLEIIYLALSFALAQIFGQWSVIGELIRTGLRVISIVFLGYFYQKHFYNEQQNTVKTTKLLTPEFNVAIVLFICLALVCTNAENESLWWQFVFVISGFTAGLREELFYRGIVQNTLQNKFDYKTALSLSTLIFTLSHVQYLYYGQIKGLILIAIAGVIFGSIFIYTGSIVITAIVHGLYDAVLSVNISPIKLSNGAVIPIMLLIMVVFLTIISKKLYPLRPLSNNIDNSNRDNLSLG